MKLAKKKNGYINISFKNDFHSYSSILELLFLTKIIGLKF